MLVDHGARYGHFDVTREMPDRTTLSHAVPNMVVKTKVQFVLNYPAAST